MSWDERDAALVLEDGRMFRGTSFGAEVDAEGEAVFTTTMTGYQEVATDPSFRGQIVCMTYPLIGNYGVTPQDDQSRQPWLSGMVVREYCDEPSNWRSEGTFARYLQRHNIPAIYGVDTRALTRHIRSRGAMRALLQKVAQRLPQLEAALAGLPIEADPGSVLQPAHLSPLRPIDDVRADAVYRHDAALTVVRRLLQTLAARARAGA